MINVSEVNFNRNGRSILSNINWEVGQNQHWVIIGPNGSGKTSLLNMIAGYEWPSSGKISVLGHLYGNCYLPDVRKSIGWVGMSLQHKIISHHRFRNEPVENIVAAGDEAALIYFGELNQTIKVKTANALKRMGLESLSNKPFSVLSQGEQKRAGRALPSRGGTNALPPLCHAEPTTRSRGFRAGSVRIHTPLGPICWSPTKARSLLSLGKVSLSGFVAEGLKSGLSYVHDRRAWFDRETSILMSDPKVMNRLLGCSFSLDYEPH